MQSLNKTVEKRRNSILKKRELKASSKAKYHSKREDKYILQAGDAFAKEKDVIGSKFKPILLQDRNRTRRQGERKALGDMFKESFISGEDLSYYIDSIPNQILVPNITNIKARIRTQLEKEYMNIGGKLQLMAFVTFKYDIKNHYKWFCYLFQSG